MVCFLDGLVDDPAFRFLDVLDLRILQIFAFLAIEAGVSPWLFEELGSGVKGARILTISVCPFHYELALVHK